MHKSEPFSRTLAFIVALLFLLIGSVIGYLIGNWGLAIAIDGVLLAAILILRPILFPPWHEHSDVRTLTLTIFAAAASSFGLWDSIVPTIVGWIFSIFGIPAPEFPTIWQQIIVLGIVGVVLVLITNAFEKKQILPQPAGQPATERGEAFPKADYKELRDRFCDYMVTVLNKIDEEVNWSDSDFTILEAEVVAEKSEGKRPKIAKDLIAAIRDDHKTRTFILIGDPGSGKSVSLRRMARELYKRVPETGIVPLYINLREWDGPREPSDSDIVEFISRYLLRVSGRTGQAFLKNWYEPMLDQGLFFFLLDSFDEIPVVMDCDDRSPELKRISEAFDRFFHDIHQCRGVLSSRPFRQPVGVRGRKLNVRPFTETQIRRAMKKWLRGWNIDADTIIRNIFVSRPELAPAVRNPFMADLISQYVISYPDKLPNTYYELYEHYVSKRLNDDIDYLRQLGLGVSDVISTATQIAWTMYNTPDTGLEIESAKLETLMDDSRLADKIKAMSFSRIARLGGIGRDKFTFVHRRFAEFFAVRAIYENGIELDPTSIPTDSRWRDAFVVYSGIAPIERVRMLANFSWQTIKENSQTITVGDFEKAMPAIHSLRFLRDACQSRPDSYSTFIDELSELVVKLVGSEDLLVAKIATEALPLITSKARTTGIELAFKRGVTWLSETALRSCRHLAILEKSTILRLQRYIITLPTKQLVLSFFDLSFNLGLSDSLRKVKAFLWLQMISLFFLLISTIVFCILFKSYALLILIALLSLAIQIYSSFSLSKTPSQLESFLYGHQLGIDSSLRKVLSFAVIISAIPIETTTRSDTMTITSRLTLFDSVTTIPEVILVLTFLICIIPFSSWFVFIQDLKVNLLSLVDYLKKAYKKVLFTVLKYSIYYLLGGYLFFLFIGYVSQTSVFENILLYFCAAMPLIVGLAILAPFIINVSHRVKDSRKLGGVVFEKDISWNMICQTLASFQTDWGQSQYLELIRTNKVNVGDYSFISELPQLKGKRSEEQLARLREQILGLQE